MRISVNQQTGFAKVLEPSFGSQDVYLDEATLDSLKSKEMLEKLEGMNLTVDFSQNRWEILEEPPFGTLGTIASIISHIEGPLKRNGNDIICTPDKL